MLYNVKGNNLQILRNTLADCFIVESLGYFFLGYCSASGWFQIVIRAGIYCLIIFSLIELKMKKSLIHSLNNKSATVGFFI